MPNQRIADKELPPKLGSGRVSEMKYFAWLNDTPHGPFDAFQLSCMVTSGMIGLATVIQKESGIAGETWVKFSDLFPNQNTQRGDTNSDSSAAILDELVQTTSPVGKFSRRVTLVDFDVPFGRLAEFIFRWTFAAIPTAFILFILIKIHLLLIKKESCILKMYRQRQQFRKIKAGRQEYRL